MQVAACFIINNKYRKFLLYEASRNFGMYNIENKLVLDTIVFNEPKMIFNVTVDQQYVFCWYNINTLY